MQKLKLEQTQKQTLTLAMRQSLHMLQLNNIELRSYLQEFTSKSAVAELAPAGEGMPAREVSYRECRAFAARHGFSHPTEGVSDEQLMRDKRSLETVIKDLKIQALSLSATRADADLLYYLIDSLDDNGYLTDNPDELAALTGVTSERLQEAIKTLKRLDPAGVGASDLIDCLRLQLLRLPAEPVRDHALVLIETGGLLERLARKQYREIGGRLGITAAQAERAGDLIRTLNPRPLNGSGSASPIRYIVPDFFILEDNHELVCEMNAYYLPKLIIHHEYKEFALEGEEAAFLKKSYEEAGSIEQFLEYRVSTLQRVVDYVIRAQEEFFRQGPGHRKAMSNREISEALSLSESTISRAVNGKYFECQWGVYPLKYLFSHSISSGSADDNIDYDKAVSVLKALIKNESQTTPLSDQRLSELLTEQGIPLSRRTIAKYRQQLGIPNTNQRRVR